MPDAVRRSPLSDPRRRLARPGGGPGVRPHTGPHTVSESASGTHSRSRRAGPMRADMSIWRTVQTSLQGPKALMFRTPDMGVESDVHSRRLGSPNRAAGVWHSEFSFAQPLADSSRRRAKVNCECLTPAVVLQALRDAKSGHPSPAAAGRRRPLTQKLTASGPPGSGIQNSVLLSLWRIPVDDAQK